MHGTSYCAFEFDSQDERSLPDNIKRILDELEVHGDVIRSLANSGGRLEFFVGWFSDFNSGDIFGWDVLARMGQLKISLALDVYGPDRDSKE